MSEVFVPAMMDDLNLLEDSGDSDEFGTTNIVLILGNYIFIATDSRLTSMDMVTIKNEYFLKIRKYAPNLYGTMCGSKSVFRGLKKHLKKYVAKRRAENQILDVYEVAKVARANLLNQMEQARKKLESNPNRTDADTIKFRYKYWNSCCFICGFDKSVPKAYSVSLRSPEVLDVSMASVHRNCGFLGSGSALAEEFIVNSQTNLLVEQINKFEMSGGIESFDDFSKTVLLRALVSANMGDRFTGGDLFVQRISAREPCLTYNCSAAQVYLEMFDIVEPEKGLILLVFLPVSTDEVMSGDNISSYFEQFGLVRYSHRLGEFNGQFMHRILFEKEMDPSKGDGEAKFANPLEVYRILLHRSNGKKCFFGLPLIQDVGFDMSLMMPAERDTLIADLLKSNR